MPVQWPYAKEFIEVRGVGKVLISQEDSERQATTAESILTHLSDHPGIILADEVGMGKTYVAMAVIASVIVATRGQYGPVVVMVPPGLRQKWQRDWRQFKIHNIREHALDWVRDDYAHTPTEFFKLIDNPVATRVHLIFITTGCFSRGLYDPWVKLAMIRLARGFTKLADIQKQRLYRWAAELTRQFSNYKLTEDIIKQLLNTNLTDWRELLVKKGLLGKDDDDPVPQSLVKEADRINWVPLCRELQDLPGWRPSYVKNSTRKDVRGRFTQAFKEIYENWLSLARWSSPLLVLDEAHHAKNDSTQLARLFRQESQDDVVLLKNKFDRMLFLSATPFQLGHHELIRVLRSFEAVRWEGKRAPKGTPEDFQDTLKKLEQALDANRLAARHLDRLWGKLKREIISSEGENSKSDNEYLIEWWQKIRNKEGSELEKELIDSYYQCVKTKEEAERLLKPWVIRHNRSNYLPGTTIPRRNLVVGKAILCESGTEISSRTDEGIPLDKKALLPFLITARAQGQLAQYPGTRAFFAEGIASSYEAFHHTREARLEAKDWDDGPSAQRDEISWLVPTKWYEEQIAKLIPSNQSPREDRMAHPKISATVNKAVELWLAGEKVLIFCFYVKTAEALYNHLKEEIHQRILQMAGEKLGLNSSSQASEIENWLARIARRLSDVESPFYQEIASIIKAEMDKPNYIKLKDSHDRLLEILMAYFRSPSFIARYIPLNDSLVYRVLVERETNRDIIAEGLKVLRRIIFEERDTSNQTFLGRVSQFLDFASELAERAEHRLRHKSDEYPDESDNPLMEYLDAVSICAKAKRHQGEGEDEIEVEMPSSETMEEDERDESYRAPLLVRKVDGKTKMKTRDTVMLAFNSPLFPEILVSSSVMGEGVDLHRFCRHIIHHDLCWNPSTMEQRTGRLDRVRCKAEICKCPIKIYEPFIAGSADEKMFRVLSDRERWFQIVMGQKYEFDEATSEEISSRIPLPDEIAKSLVFDLARWKHNM